MRVLFDENLNQRLKSLLDEGFEVTTVKERGWNGKSNGELLRLAESEFAVFITTDRGMPYQQNLLRFDLVVVILEAKSNAFEDLAPLMERANIALDAANPGEALRIRT